MVYVDELRKYGHGPRCFRGGACHMTADTLDELHAMARKLGLKREWFQKDSTVPHYDLTVSKREKALECGAVFKGAREQARERRSARKAAAIASAQELADELMMDCLVVPCGTGFDVMPLSQATTEQEQKAVHRATMAPDNPQFLEAMAAWDELERMRCEETRDEYEYER